MFIEAALGLDACTFVYMQVARKDKTFTERLAIIRQLIAFLPL